MIELKNLFKKLQTDAKSVLFAKFSSINDKILKKLKKSRYNKDIEFVNLFKSNIDFLDAEKKSIPIKSTFVEKKDDIDRSTLNSSDGPFQLLHVNVGNLEFLGKSATNPNIVSCFLTFLHRRCTFIQ